MYLAHSGEPPLAFDFFSLFGMDNNSVRHRTTLSKS
jgi:hypothetical protein